MDVKLTGGHVLERKLAQIARNLSSSAEVRVGFLDNATYPDGTSVALVATVQEFGSPVNGIPPRPFFRNMIADKSPGWPKALEKLLVANGYDAKIALGQMGAGIAGQLRQSIVDTNSPPNAPSTIAKKGSSKPLVDTGHMLQSIDFEVS
jgi:hypothetical protein